MTGKADGNIGNSSEVGSYLINRKILGMKIKLSFRV